MHSFSKIYLTHFLGRKNLLSFDVLHVSPWLEEQISLEGIPLYSACTLDLLLLSKLVESLLTLSPFF